MADFTEVADRVWVARYEWFDVNVSLVGSERGLVMVDTHGSASAAREVVDDVRRLGAGEVVTVVNTHCHFDHTFGNATILETWPGPVWAHETVPDDLAESSRRIRAAYAGDPEDPKAADIAETTLALPTDTFSSVHALDLGDRLVELVHPGRGHSRGDVVVHVPDARTLLAGDLVEESADPVFGVDSWPMDWPLSLDTVLQLLTPQTLVVPGHGAPVDRDFVEVQRNQIGIVAETIRDLASRGVPLEEALTTAEDWPFERDRLGDAVRRGYEQLPRSQKRLPLV